MSSDASASDPPVVSGIPSGLAGREAVVVGAGDGPVAFATFAILTAAFLNSGCFETASHSVTVSSFAAVECLAATSLAASQ